MDTPLVFSFESSDGDFTLMELVLRKCLAAVDLRRARDGEHAVTLLKKSEIAIDEPRPDLILLDLNLSLGNGFDVLKFIRSQDFIRNAPVIVFSEDAHEERKALALGADEFIIKPNNLDGMSSVLNSVCTKYLGGTAVVL